MKTDGLKLKDALKKHNSRRGKRITQRELGAILWPNSTKPTQIVNINNLCSGKTKRIDISMVSIICDTLRVDANYLFNIKT